MYGGEFEKHACSLLSPSICGSSSYETDGRFKAILDPDTFLALVRIVEIDDELA
jgi:hypothetical protein